MPKNKKTGAKLKHIVVLYHKNCTDGFASAWAAWKKLGTKASYVGVTHQAPPPQGLKGKVVYMVDYTYPEKYLRRLIKENERVTAIDHHISAERATKLTEGYSYALGHSGAVLTWKYFHPTKKVPRLLGYVEDFDLWKWRLRGTREVMGFLELVPFEFAAFSATVKKFEKSQTRKACLAEGKKILEYQDILIDKIVAKAEVVRFAGHRTLAVNTPLFQSQVCDILYKKLPPMSIAWFESGGVKKVSLRSQKGKKVDVSKLAARYGGGGHRTAAAFKMKANKKLPWK